VRKFVDDLRAEASRIRGLPWKHDVPADLLSRDQMVELFRKELDEEYPPEERQRDDKILRRLGLLQPDEDIVKLTLILMREGVAGLYDPKTKRMYLIEGVSNEGQRPTILHELIHALEDQHFDLRARVEPYEDDNPNRVFAELCIQEGSAEHARALYEKDNPDAAKKAREEEQSMEDLQRQLTLLREVPAYVILNTALHYDLGPKLVEAYVGRDYPNGMNWLFAHPPTTQEQLIHREKWLGEKRDLERRVVWGGDLVAAAGPGWRKLHEMAVGELDVALFLDYHLGGRKGRVNPIAMSLGLWASAPAMRAASGWDAGRDLFLEKDGLPLAHASAFAFDTPRDATQAGEAFRDALAALYGAGGFDPKRTEAEGVVVLDWTTKNGAGRLRVRGDEMLLLDGLPADRFEAVWAVLEKTRFERQPGDAYPPPPEHEAPPVPAR
jgi:hypothetical protein